MSLKDEIVNYILKTPENSNPNVLRSIIDSSGGGGGGDLVIAHAVVGPEIFDSSEPQELTIDKTYEELLAAGINSAVQISVQMELEPGTPPIEYVSVLTNYAATETMDFENGILMYTGSIPMMGNILVGVSDNLEIIGPTGAMIMIETAGGNTDQYNVKFDYQLLITVESSSWVLSNIYGPGGSHSSASGMYSDLDLLVTQESGKHRISGALAGYTAPLTEPLSGNIIFNSWTSYPEYNESTGSYDIDVRYLWGWKVYNGKLIFVTICGRSVPGETPTITVTVDSYNLAAEGTTIAHATITNTDFYALPDIGASITIDKTWAELYAANDSIIELTLTNSDRDYKIPLRKMESESPGYDPNGAIEYVSMVPVNFTNYRYSYLKDEFSDLWLISVRVDEGSTTSATIRTRKYYSQPFIIGISAQATLESGTRYYANKTAAEIRNAFDLGREIWFDFNTTLYTGKVLATGMHLNSSYNNRRTIKAWFHSYTKCIEIDLIVEDNSTNVGVAIYSAQQQLDLDYS